MLIEMRDLSDYNKFTNLFTTSKNVQDFDTCKYQSRIIGLTGCK